MKTQIERWNVETICKFWRDGALRVNHEYQRAPSWNRTQKQMLIDSVLRRYSLPLFFFHKKPRSFGNQTIDQLEVIDGQQRILALVDYADGEFDLLDPVKHKNRFPKFISSASEPCRWADRTHGQLDKEDLDCLNTAELQVAIIETGVDDEVRDLFVRLQGGSPLKPQEKRDALPGGMAQFIKSLGGETVHDEDQEVVVKGGHEFFASRLEPKLSTPGRTVHARQLAAQIVLQLDRDRSERPLAATNNRSLDEFYHEHIGFQVDGAEAERFLELFDDVCQTLDNLRVPPLTKTDWIHLFVLWQRLQQGFTNSWKNEIKSTIQKFKSEVIKARKAVEAGELNPMYTGYAMHLSGRGQDGAEKNRLRQEFFDRWFVNELTLVQKDPSRIFPERLRERFFDAQEGFCGYFDHDFCPKPQMDYGETELHHILPHHMGGRTEVSNAVAVHAYCNGHIGKRHFPVKSNLILNALSHLAENH